MDEFAAIVKKGDYFKVTQILEGAGLAMAPRRPRQPPSVMKNAMSCFTTRCVPSSSQTIIAANVDALRKFMRLSTPQSRRLTL